MAASFKYVVKLRMPYRAGHQPRPVQSLKPARSVSRHGRAVSATRYGGQ